MNLTYDWQKDIEPLLNQLQSVPGGFTEAKRGLLVLADGTRAFIKIAEDDDTRKWIRKEVEVYMVLGRENYAYAPRILSHSPDKTALAIEYLETHQFDHPWDESMLREVMDARLALKELKPFFEGNETYNLHSVVNVQSRWPSLKNDEALARLNRVLHETGNNMVIDPGQVEQFAQEMLSWKPREDTLVHQDIRADNFGYDPTGKQGKLVDWNWLCIGDELMDVTPMFVSVQKNSGIDPYELYPELYSRESLLYIAGYWLAALNKVDITAPISPLRAHQAASAVVALSMLKP